jgi:toxin ParE1/3/4
MSWPVRLRAAAEKDVAAHAEYIQRDSLDAALRFLDAVDAAISLLSRMPEIGGLCRFSKPHYAGLRVWPIGGFKNYLIFYRVFSDEIEVVRVLHGARDLRVIFGEEVK